MRHRYFRRPILDNPYTPNPEAQAVAEEFCERVGFPPMQPTPYATNNVTVQKELAQLFINTPDQSDQDRVRRSYAELLKYVKTQWSMLPVKVEPFGDDFVPYKDSPAMMDDVLENQHLWVYDGGSDHTLLTRRENFHFRAVHDYYGHCILGVAFGPRGEENAWMEHSKMFPPSARHALTCETRTQNSFVNFGPHSHLPVKDRPYADQKAIWIPSRFCTRTELQRAYRDYPSFFPTPTADNPQRRR